MLKPGRRNGVLLGFYTQSSTWAQRLQQATRERLEPRVLCRLGLGLLGRVRHHRQPRRPWIVRLTGFYGGIDDGGRRKLALSDPLLNFAEDVGHGEDQMVRRCRHHRALYPAVRELSLENGHRQLGADISPPREDSTPS